MTFVENSLREGVKYQCTHARRMSPKDCHACRFDRCVRAGLNMQEYGPTHNVLPRDRRGNTKWNLSGDCLPQRGLVPTASTSDILQKVVAATSARRVDEKKKPERNVVTSVGKPGINDNDNMKINPTSTYPSFSTGASSLSGIHCGHSGSASQASTSYAASGDAQYASASLATRRCIGCGSNLIGFSRSTTFCQPCMTFFETSLRDGVKYRCAHGRRWNPTAITNRPSAVWEYFTKQSDFMVCKLCPDGIARARLSGTLASNAKQHLKLYHKDQHEEVQVRDAQRPLQFGLSRTSRREEPTFCSSSYDCHACRFDRLVRAGMNTQWFGLQHDVLAKGRRGNSKWTISDEWLRRRGVPPVTSSSGNHQEVDAVPSARGTAAIVNTITTKNNHEKKRRANALDWDSDAVKEILDLRDALQLSTLDTYQEFLKRGIRVHYLTVQQRLHQIDVIAGRKPPAGPGVDWNGDAVKEILELRKANGLSAMATHRELERRGIHMHYNALRIRLHMMDAEARQQEAKTANTQPQVCPVRTPAENGSAYLVANAAPPTHLTLPIRRSSQTSTPKDGAVCEGRPNSVSRLASSLSARTPTPHANVSANSEEELANETFGRSSTEPIDESRGTSAAQDPLVLRPPSPCHAGEQPSNFRQRTQQAPRLDSPPAQMLTTPHYNRSVGNDALVDSEDQLIDELEEIIDQAWATGPTGGSRKASVTSDNESVICVSDCRTQTEREDESHARTLPPLRQPPALSYREEPSSHQQRTRKSVQLESLPVSTLLTPQTNDFVNNEDEFLDQVEGTVEQAWSTGRTAGSSSASVARNSESMVCVADCHTPTEREDESQAQSSPPLQPSAMPYCDELSSSFRQSTRQSPQLESPPASVLMTPQANDFVDSEDELLNELEGIVEKACSTDPTQRNDASPRDLGAPVESDGESVVCLSDCTALTQRNRARPGHPLLQPYAQRSVEVSANCRQSSRREFQRDSATTRMLLAPRVNISAGSEGNLVDEIEPIVGQALPTRTDATYRIASFERDCESVVCLSDGHTLPEREGIRPGHPPLRPSAEWCVQEPVANYQESSVQEFDADSASAPPLITPRINVFADNEGDLMNRIEDIIGQAVPKGTDATYRTATFERDCESVVCLSEGPLSTQREEIIPNFRHLPPPAPLRFAERPRSTRQIQYQPSRIQSSLVPPMLTNNTSRLVYGEDHKLGEFAGTIQQAWSTAPKANQQKASFQSDGESVTFLLDCPTSMRREGIKPTSPSGLLLLRPPMQRYGDGLSNYPGSICQASQLESSFATSKLNPTIRISVDGEDKQMDGHHRIGHQACSTGAQVRSVDRSLCNQMPAVSFGKASHAECGQ
ncbi:hypothetical protein AAVH_19223 [Aphelenchoides avenae]|nr:hypothetical protein AAVH_19223 [Aphelenchus avenae]